MTTSNLAKSYLQKATTRLKILPVLMKEKAYSDVIREAQEIVELALKGMLRKAGIEPPLWHDVGNFLLTYKEKFPQSIQKELPRLTRISRWLRKERELSFYGDIDFVPTEEYSKKEGKKAREDAIFCVKIARKVIK